VGLGQGLHGEKRRNKKNIIKDTKHAARSELGAEVKFCITYCMFQK
jgi:hypothetical protein